MKLLVTDADERSTLCLVRSLGRRDEVHVASDGAVSLAGRSRWAAPHHRLPSPLERPAAFAGAARELCTRLGIELLIPVSDAALQTLLPSRKALLPTRLAAPEPGAYEALSDKVRAAELARQFGFDVPRGQDVGSPEEAERVARELGFPVVLKPSHSILRCDDGGLSRPAVRVAGDPAALRRAWAPGVDRALVQECVEGHGEGLFLLRWSGRTRAVFGHRRLREKPPGGGTSVLRESVAVQPERVERLEELLDAVGYDGIVMAEFKNDGERSWFMEFNARPWGSLQLAVDAGIDVPRLWIDALCNRDEIACPGYCEGVRSRWWLGDLDHAIALARGTRDPEGRHGLRAALSVLLRRTGPGSRLEVLRWEDPRPFAYELRRWLKDLRRGDGAAVLRARVE